MYVFVSRRVGVGGGSAEDCKTVFYIRTPQDISNG
jgi:hypothetical protein